MYIYAGWIKIQLIISCVNFHYGIQLSLLFLCFLFLLKNKNTFLSEQNLSSKNIIHGNMPTHCSLHLPFIFIKVWYIYIIMHTFKCIHAYISLWISLSLVNEVLSCSYFCYIIRPILLISFAIKRMNVTMFPLKEEGNFFIKYSTQNRKKQYTYQIFWIVIFQVDDIIIHCVVKIFCKKLKWKIQAYIYLLNQNTS